MHGESLIPVVLFLVVGACIVIPIWLRNMLMRKQLDTVAAAIEKGIDPARIGASMPAQQRTGDINGNWKAGQILIWLGIGYCLFLALPVVLLEQHSITPEVVGIFSPGVLSLVIGASLTYIHRTIIGEVIKQTENNGLLNKPPENL
jgi:hypothetical protein